MRTEAKSGTRNGAGAGHLHVERETVAVLRVRTSIVAGDAEPFWAKTTGGTTKPTVPPADSGPPPSRGACGVPGCGHG